MIIIKISYKKSEIRIKKKYDKNIKVLKYLDKNYEICRKSNFNVIGDMTFKDIFNEYLKSEEFEKEIEKLKDEQNSEKYIKDYILKAYNFIHYFSKPICKNILYSLFIISYKYIN